VSPVGTADSFTVEATSDEQLTTGIGVSPVALVHLSELQALTETTTDDPADQLLVSTNDASVAQRLEGLYPNTVVVTRTGIATQQVSSSSLPLAMGVAAFIIALVVGVLFTATMMGLEVTNDRRAFGTLTALGYSTRTLTVLVAVETLWLALVGGVLGVIGGSLALIGINAVAGELFGVSSLAVFDPLLVVYGLAVAVVIGLLAVPYPIWVSRRTDPLEVLQ